MALAVNQTGGNSTTAVAGAAISFTFGSSTVSGSLIVVAVPGFNPPAWTSTFWTDSNSNTYTGMDNTGTGVTEHLGVAYNDSGTRGASHQCTWDPSGTGMSSDFGGIEFTGHDTTTQFETACTGKANDTASPFDVTAGAAFPSGAAAVYVASIGGASGSATVGNPTGYTLVMQQGNADTSLVGYVGYKLSETGTPTVGCTWTGTVGSESPQEMIIAVRAAAGAAGDAPVGLQPFSVGPYRWQSWFPAIGIDIPAAAGNDVNVTGRLDTGTFLVTGGYNTDYIVTGHLPTGGPLYATVTADRTVVGHLPTAAPFYSTITTDRTVTGLLESGAPLYAAVTHSVSLAGHLPTGTFLLNGIYATGVPTFGVLFTGTFLRAAVTADRTIAGHLPTAVPLYATVSHTITVAGHLPTAAPLYGLVTGAGDLNTFGILFTGTFPRGTVTADRTPSGLLTAGTDLRAAVAHTASVTGLLTSGAPLYGTITRTVSFVGYLPVGDVLYALYSVGGPEVADLYPIRLRFTESGLAVIETASLTAVEPALYHHEDASLTGRDAWTIGFEETPS